MRRSRPGDRTTGASTWKRVLLFLGSVLLAYYAVTRLLQHDGGSPTSASSQSTIHGHKHNGSTDTSGGGGIVTVAKDEEQHKLQADTGEASLVVNGQLQKQAQVAADAAQEPQCHAVEHAEFEGEWVNWAYHEVLDSEGECCDRCRAEPRCNVWNFCADASGCGPTVPRGACWLKHQLQSPPDLKEPKGRRGPDVPWTSGAVYIDGKRQAAEGRIAKENAKELQRLKKLKADRHLPLVYMDVEVKGEPWGRMLFVLFADESPRAAESFRLLFTGEKGIVPEGHEGSGRPYHLKGAYFYRVMHGFIDQGGVDVDSPLTGGTFKDDPGGLELKHDRKGLLSIANAGPNTNTAHFSIMVAPCESNDGNYVVFGEMVKGWEVAQRINELSLGKKENTATRADGIKIVDAGQLRRG